MGVNAQQRFDQARTGSPAGTATALSGSAPQTGAGNKLDMSRIQPGTLSAEVYGQATTNTLTITGKWQVSDNASTWYDADLANNAADVALVTGTGSAVASTKQFDAPAAVYGSRWARFVVVTGVASASTGDEYTIGYSYRARTSAPVNAPPAVPGTVTALSGTAGTVVSGAALQTAKVEPGTLYAHVYAKAGTSSLVLTGKWQVSSDGSTWNDCTLPNNAANVAIATATAETTIRISAPSSAIGQRFCRFSIVTSGAAAVGSTTDQYGIGYGFVPAGRNDIWI